MKSLVATAILSAFCLTTSQLVYAYPLDGSESGIGRLVGFQPQTSAKGAPKLPAGGKLSLSDVRLNLVSGDVPWDTAGHDRDPELQKALEKIFRTRDPSYGVVVVDFTDPENVAWAGVRENIQQIPGSVGKLLTMLGLFSELAKAFPDANERARLLSDHVVTAGDWVISDEHAVPRYDAETNVIRKSVIKPGERFTLSEWVDHMIAASANSAAATIWKETILLRKFGAAYPPSMEEEELFFRNTSKRDLWSLASDAIKEPMAQTGLDSTKFWVGSLWTRTGKVRIPGSGNSTATPMELARFLLRLEQGHLVDEWSSLEMKRYLYTTSRRYRYVFSPELEPAAAYFKSGSLYKCKPEEGFKCGKYMGNDQNFMNSVAIIESPASKSADQKRYAVALISNVLKVNSAWDHARLGAAIEEVIRFRMPVSVRDEGADSQIRAAGGD